MNVTSREVGFLAAGAGVAYLLSKLLKKEPNSLDLDNCTLQYFPIPALGEPIRLMLTLAGIPFTDERVPGSKFATLKPSLPFGQMPVLMLKNGKRLTQCRAIARLIGKSTVVDGEPLYAEDATLAYASDEVIDVVMDLQTAMAKTFGIKDKDKMLEARAALFKEGGFCKDVTDKLEAFLTQKGTKYAIAGHMTAADIFVFTIMNSMRCGFLDGIDKEFLNDFPTLLRLVSTVAAHPSVQAYYAAQPELYACFKQ